MKNEKKTQDRKPGQWFLLLLLAASMYLAFSLVRVYIHSLILAVLLASALYPVHEWIKRCLRGKKNLSAFASCLLVILLIVLPLVLILIGMVNQGIRSVNAVRGWLEQGNLERLLQSDHWTYLHRVGSRYLSFLHLEIGRFQDWMIRGSQYIGQFLLSKGGTLVSNLGSLFLHFWIMIFILFYLLRDGKKWLDWFLHLFPLTKRQENILIDRLRIVGRSALIGSLLTAIAQGVVGGIGLWIVGIPPLFWGSLIAAASFIPLLGTSLVWLPAVIYLFIIQKNGQAIFLLIYSVAILGSIDNFLRPYLMPKQKDISMPNLLVFLAILGGIHVFGLVGVLYGPMIFGLLSSLLYLYEVEFSSFLDQQDRSSEKEIR
ncbi:MAG: AI-2E family transporter [bacterium]